VQVPKYGTTSTAQPDPARRILAGFAAAEHIGRVL
jgi:hypothetical protein